MTEEQELQRSKNIQRVNTAYQQTFSTEEGKMVLANLKSYFRLNRPAFERSLGHPFDPVAAAIRDGQREVILFIEHKLSLPVQADGDVNQPKTTVTRE